MKNTEEYNRVNSLLEGRWKVINKGSNQRIYSFNELSQGNGFKVKSLIEKEGRFYVEIIFGFNAEQKEVMSISAYSLTLGDSTMFPEVCIRIQ